MTQLTTRASAPAATGGSLGRRAGDALILALLLLVALLILTPFVWLFSTSLRLPRESFTLPPRWLPTDFHVENYLTVFETVDFFRFFRNSVLLSVLTVAGQLVFASMAAYAFARLRFPFKNLLFILLMAGLMIPIQATIIPVFILIGWMRLNDSLWSLILPNWASAFGVFLLRQYFLTIPNDLEDAARVDGASVWRIYWSVMLPLVRPALAVLAILTFNASWNEYFRPFIFLTTPEVFTLPLGLVTLRGYLGSGSVAVVLAGVVLALLPTFVLYIFSQRYLVEGITATGIKG